MSDKSIKLMIAGINIVVGILKTVELVRRQRSKRCSGVGKKH